MMNQKPVVSKVPGLKTSFKKAAEAAGAFFSFHQCTQSKKSNAVLQRHFLP